MSLQWFNDRKPYQNNVKYDLEYLKIFRHLFYGLGSVLKKTNGTMGPNEMRELAYIVTAYFEDRVNKIGFWETVLAEHQTLYGKRIPFYTTEELAEWDDCEDIHPADIHYLTFVYCAFLHRTKQIKEMPPEMFFIGFRDLAFDYLDQIEEVRTTDFYKEMLVADGSATEFKNILQWFAYDSYLFGYELKYYWLAQGQQLRQQEPNIDKRTLEINMQIVMNDIMHKRNTSLSGLNPVDVLAKTLNWPGQKRQDTMDFKFYVEGVFEIDETDPKYYYFKHNLMNDVFPVLKTSIPNLKPGSLARARYYRTVLQRWDGAYILAAPLAAEMDEDHIFFWNKEFAYDYSVHNKAFRERQKEALKAEADEAFTFFGVSQKTFRNAEEMINALNTFYKWQFDKAVREGRADAGKYNAIEARTHHIGAETDLCIHIAPDDGMSITSNHYATLNRLNELRSVYGLANDAVLMVPIPISAWQNLWESFKPVPATNDSWCINTMDDLMALFRIYRPKDFSALRKPVITLLDLSYR